MWLLFIAKRVGYRLVDPVYYENLRGKIRAAVTGSGLADPATLALAGLVYAGDISQLVFPGRENAPLRDRLAKLARPDSFTFPTTPSGIATLTSRSQQSQRPTRSAPIGIAPSRA